MHQKYKTATTTWNGRQMLEKKRKRSKKDIFRNDITPKSDLLLLSVNFLSKEFKLLHK